MSDELLSRVDVLQHPLQELEGEALFHGRRVLLQVLQTSVGQSDQRGQQLRERIRHMIKTKDGQKN